MISNFEKRLKRIGFKPVKDHAGEYAIDTKRELWFIDVHREPDGVSVVYTNSRLNEGVLRLYGKFDTYGNPIDPQDTSSVRILNQLETVPKTSS